MMLIEGLGQINIVFLLLEEFLDMGFGGIFDLEFMNLSLLINLIVVNLELEFYYFLFDLKG